MIAHRIVNALRGRGGSLMEPRELWRPRAEREALANAIVGAQKFDFGRLMLEKRESSAEFTERFGTKYVIPQLSADEAEFFQAGLVPLPFRVVWYEFIIGDTPSALLVEEAGERVWRTQRLEYDTVADEVMFDGMVVDVLLRERYMTERWAMVRGKRDNRLLEMMESVEFTSLNYGANAPLTYYLTLMLSSRTTHRAPGAAPPPKVAAAQRRKGREPLPPHTVVRIVPDSYLKESEAEGARTHASPRLHWRRSHLRHYDHRVPSAQYAAGITHQGKTGWWCTVIPRMLVGRADLGEVSHEYFVKSEQGAAASAPESRNPTELVK